MFLTHQLFCVKDLSSKGKSTRRANSGIPRATHTLEATVFLFFATREAIWGRSVATTTTRTLRTSHCHLYPFLFFFFAPDVSTTLQASDECELHNSLPLCVGPKNHDEKPLWRGRKCKGGLSPSLTGWRCLSLHKF